MNANPTNGVGILAVDPLPAVQPGEAVRVESSRPVEAQPLREKPAEPQKLPDSNQRSDIRLRFLVDARSQEVTVLILDRASKRVLRTIPPDELTRLNAGDLVELFA